MDRQAARLILLLVWALWAHDQRFTNLTDTGWDAESSTWTLLGSSSTEAACRDALRERIEAVAKEAVVPHVEVHYLVRGGDTIEFYFTPRPPLLATVSAQVLRYVCLPGAVDPRKGRPS